MAYTVNKWHPYQDVPYEHKVIYLEDMEFMGDDRKHSKIIQLWRSQGSIFEISKAINEPLDKTFLILLHLARKGQIKSRGNNGIFGEMYEEM